VPLIIFSSNFQGRFCALN